MHQNEHFKSFCSSYETYYCAIAIASAVVKLNSLIDTH